MLHFISYSLQGRYKHDAVVSLHMCVHTPICTHMEKGELGSAYIITSSHFTDKETDFKFERSLSMWYSLICKYLSQSLPVFSFYSTLQNNFSWGQLFFRGKKHPSFSLGFCSLLNHYRFSTVCQALQLNPQCVIGFPFVLLSSFW